MSKSNKRLAVLHVALNPITGVWSVMRGLAEGQSRSGLYEAVGIGIIADRAWPALCTQELVASGLPVYQKKTPKLFGTAQFLLQKIVRPPIDNWVRDLLKQSKAEKCIVHFHNAWLSGVFLPLATVREGLARVVVTVHGVNAHFRGQPVRQLIHQWFAAGLLKHKAALTSVDQANLERAWTILKLPQKHFTVIPNGVSDTSQRACPVLSGSKTFTLGHVGNINDAKGWKILVEAASRLRKRNRPVKVILAGRGPDAEQALQMARQNSEWLEYRGFVPNPRDAVFPELDALVLMSEQEGLPMAIVESFSLGLPVVATAVGGVPEAISNGRNGLLVARAPEALEKAIESLLDHPEKLQAFSAQARGDFVKRFEISGIISRYNQLYNSHA